ncbi:MAG TPA: non-homologous end-joining DNA ligase [Haliangiales bacterium]|nr:non-homologous end-joining DNA ligase [Haliangiales bacterium]
MQYRFGELTVACTNVDRVMFPADGITKREVIAYYHDVAAAMLPELRRRPLTIERFTKSIAEGGFYQKHAQKHYPAWIERVELGGKTPVAYPLCDTPAALVYFANQGALALHVWTSRCDTPFCPDEIVFDLDPPEGRFDLVTRVARLLRDLLDALDLPAFVKTSGSKGLHIVAPLDGDAGFDEVNALGTRVAAHLCRRHPDLATTEFYKKDRGGRLFLDVMRNAPGATLIAPYSLRARAGAPVSAPIEWREVDDEGLRPDGFRLRDIRARLDASGDPWRALRERAGSARTALASLARISGEATHAAKPA